MSTYKNGTAAMAQAIETARMKRFLLST